MDERFPALLSESRVPVETAKVESRWQAVESMRTQLTSKTIVELLQFFVAPTRTSGIPESLLAVVRKADPAFTSDAANNELRALAGITLRLAIEGQAVSVAAASSYGLIVSVFRRSNLPPTLPSFANDARRRLSVLSEERRAQINKPVALPNVEVALTEASKPLFQPGQLQQAHDSLIKSFEAVARQLNETSKAVRHVDEAGRAHSEESNILWWLITEWSRFADKRVDAISATEGCLLLADELSSLIEILPAPVVVAPVLLRMLDQTSNLSEATILACVEATPLSWREEVKNRAPSRVLDGICPILTAISASLSTNAGQWLPVFTKNCPIAGDVAVGHKDLAVEFLTELLFLKALKLTEEGR